MRRFVSLILFVAACDSGPPSTTSGLVDRWRSAELAPGPFAKADPIGGGSCTRGEVSGVEVTVCEHKDAAAAKAAESAGLAVVGSATGAAIAEGPLLVVVADRKNADPDGKKIDKLTRAMRGK
jgi:hypothetical protein